MEYRTGPTGQTERFSFPPDDVRGLDAHPGSFEELLWVAHDGDPFSATLALFFFARVYDPKGLARYGRL